MEGFFSIVGKCLGSLFVVAVAVAWWEHLRAHARPAPPLPEAPKAVRVDLDVETLVAAQGDTGERQRALEGALSRAAAEPVPWVETTPSVAPGTLAPAHEAAAGKP